MSNVTKEGVEVQVGQHWQDLDKRMKGRIRMVAEIKDGRVRMKHPAIEQMPHTWVSIRRMHRASTGWALVGFAQSDRGEKR